MNFGGNRALDLAAERAEQEREAGVIAASDALRQRGTCECVDCGATISAARKRVYPAATRCLECQIDVEKEAYLK
ncbi:dksA/traR C4-type zinc finger [Rhizobium sp. RU35A]|uniref:TraR/DksA C4-type zinc finger protein n=1 Tax=Rhizobium sp. RU35A TaxID=1907414 RepID=UPI000955D872|nr:TraR/DksA C4-type zinc finger protein [Rhizobium sp. RU35A]SIP88836.1 dksA/traR C4-type zinc finger [Rhizobium sp. RU35A]